MNLEKGWWKSRTIWMGIIGAVFSVLGLLGVQEVLVVDQGTIVDTIMAVVTAITSVGAIYYRVVAKEAISTKVVPASEE